MAFFKSAYLFIYFLCFILFCFQLLMNHFLFHCFSTLFNCFICPQHFSDKSHFCSISYFIFFVLFFHFIFISFICHVKFPSNFHHIFYLFNFFPFYFILFVRNPSDASICNTLAMFRSYFNLNCYLFYLSSKIFIYCLFSLKIYFIFKIYFI